jgi:hypothetical protein
MLVMNNFGCYTGIVVKFIIIVVFCVPKHDESFDSVIELGPCTSGVGPVVGPCELCNELSVCGNDGNVVTV